MIHQIRPRMTPARRALLEEMAIRSSVQRPHHSRVGFDLLQLGWAEIMLKHKTMGHTQRKSVVMAGETRSLFQVCRDDGWTLVNRLAITPDGRAALKAARKAERKKK